MHRNH